MKKILITLIILILTVSLTGCLADKLSGQNVSSDSSQSTGSTSSVSSASSSSDSATASNKLDEKGLRALMKENLNCVQNIFMSNSLETYGPALKDNIYQVDMTTYKNYSEFESYIKSIYTKDIADMLLNDYPYEGDPKYINADGKLCINMNHSGGKGYFVDWSDYKVEIVQCDAETCEFNLTAAIEEPSDNPQKQPYTVSAKAEFENGKWLLARMVY